MAIVTFYRNNPNAPKPTRPARLGVNAVITCRGKLLLEKRRDSDTWGLIGGGVKKWEQPLDAMVREAYEELGLRISGEKFIKRKVYGDPGRIAAYQDGSIWRMVVVLYTLELEDEPEFCISPESRALRFFTPEELKETEIVVTHSDMVADWFPQSL